MIQSRFGTALMAVVISATAGAHSAAHEHGRSRIQVAIDATHIALEWRIPMGDVAGFEGHPSAPEQQSELDAAFARLRESSAKITLEGAGACQIGSVDTRLDGPADHPDILLSATWNCSNAEKLSAIAFDPWTAIPGHERITVEWLSGSSQGHAEWTPPATRLSLEP
jgi:hypothetical protein